MKDVGMNSGGKDVAMEVLARAELPGEIGTHILQRTDDGQFEQVLDVEGGVGAFSGPFIEAFAGGESRFGIGEFHSFGPCPSPLMGFEIGPKSLFNDHIALQYMDFNGTQQLSVKLFNHPSVGDHPAAQNLQWAGFDRTPYLLGTLTVDYEGEELVLGVIETHLPGTSGEQVGRNCTAASYYSYEQMSALGEAIRKFHTLSESAFGSRMVPAETLRAQWMERIDRVSAAHPIIAERRDLIAAAYARITGEVKVQRIHSNLTLSALLLEGEDIWKIIGFEGDEFLPIAERVAPRPALYDLARLKWSLYEIGFASSWHTKTMSAIIEGYSDDFDTKLYVACLYDDALSLFERLIDDHPVLAELVPSLIDHTEKTVRLRIAD